MILKRIEARLQTPSGFGGHQDAATTDIRTAPTSSTANRETLKAFAALFAAGRNIRRGYGSSARVRVKLEGNDVRA